MVFINEIFTRLDIQNIREFLLYGVDVININPKSYKERIDETHECVIEFINSKFSDVDECEEIKGKIYDYATACEEVYMEIGMRCGAKLAMQLFGMDNMVAK